MRWIPTSLKLFFIFSFTLQAFAARLISATPALTEILQELGQKDNIVGVSRYCPLTLPKVGTSLAPDLEQILRLRPDHIFLSESSGTTLKRKIAKLNLNAHWYPLRDLGDIIQTIKSIAGGLNIPQKGRELVEKIESSFPSKLPTQKKVLVAVESNLSAGTLVSSRIAGEKTFYDDILKRLGMSNAAKGPSYPLVDREFLAKANVQKIFLVLPANTPSTKVSAITRAWSEALGDKLFTIQKDYAVIPGPHIHRLIKKMAHALQ